MSLAGWDTGRVTVSSSSFNENDGTSDWMNDGPNTNNLEIPLEDAKQRFLKFIRDFKIDKTFIYR